MSLKHSITTADYLDWNQMLWLVRKLFDAGDYKMSLLIGCGCFFGLRISDLLRLTWQQILYAEKFAVVEKKTGKTRTVKINAQFQKHIEDCYKALNEPDLSKNCFVSQKGSIYSVQRINVRLKEIKAQYHLNIEHFSSHSMRKTFGRQVVSQAGIHSESALIMLSEMFNHSSTMITRRYLGLRQKEMMEIYDSLHF